VLQSTWLSEWQRWRTQIRLCRVLPSRTLTSADCDVFCALSWPEFGDSGLLAGDRILPAVEPHRPPVFERQGSNSYVLSDCKSRLKFAQFSGTAAASSSEHARGPSGTLASMYFMAT